MNAIQKAYPANGKKFVVATLASGENSVLNDTTVVQFMTDNNLRPVKRDELPEFIAVVEPERTANIAFFGNKANGPSDSGSFVGVPFLDVNGKLDVEQDWTRGNTGDQWNGEWMFAFVEEGEATDMAKRYWLRTKEDPWQETTENEFIRAERNAGFYPKSGNGVATGGFSSTRSNVRGRVTYGEITAKTYPREPEFVALAQKSIVVSAQPTA